MNDFFCKSNFVVVVLAVALQKELLLIKKFSLGVAKS